MKKKKNIDSQVKEKVKDSDKDSKKSSRSRGSYYEKSFRGRYIAFLVYPEDNSGFFKLLQDRGLCCAISPLHDSDPVLDSEGNICYDEYGVIILKKSHYHVLVDFGRRYSEGSILTFIKDIAANGVYTPVANPEAYYRYLTHEDDYDKIHYDYHKIMLLGGFNVRNLPSSRLDASIELSKMIIEYNFRSYSSVCQYVLKIGRVDLYSVLISNVNHFTSLCRGNRDLPDYSSMSDCDSDLQVGFVNTQLDRKIS